MKGSENGKTDILSRKPEYYKNKKHVSYTILIVRELGLEYNKSQLTIIVRLRISD